MIVHKKHLLRYGNLQVECFNNSVSGLPTLHSQEGVLASVFHVHPNLGKSKKTNYDTEEGGDLHVGVHPDVPHQLSNPLLCHGGWQIPHVDCSMSPAFPKVVNFLRLKYPQKLTSQYVRIHHSCGIWAVCP